MKAFWHGRTRLELHIVHQTVFLAHIRFLDKYEVAIPLDIHIFQNRHISLL